MIKRITGNVFESTIRNVSQLKTKKDPIEIIRIQSFDAKDLFVREINPKLRAKEEVRKFLLEAKIGNTPENLYYAEEVNEFIRKTPISTDNDLSLFKTLNKSDTPVFSLDEISLIMNYKKNKINIPFPSDWSESFANKFKTGNEFQDIVIGSKIKTIGYLIGQGIKDNVIGKVVSNKVKDLIQMREVHYEDLTGKLNDLIDLVCIDASARGVSYPLAGESYKYSRLKYGYADHERILQELKQTPINQKPKDKDAVLFKNETELDCLKSYLMYNAFFEPDFSKYLYETYYLSRLSPKPRAICKKISDEFGTKVFVENTSRDKAATILYEELCEWQRASKSVGKDFKKPSIFNLTRYNTHYAKRKDGGYMSYLTNEISIKSDKYRSMLWALRHEMIHMNCEQNIMPEKASESISLWLKGDNVIENFVLDNQYTKEMFNAGLPQQKIRYAHKNEDEFLAVAGEGDYSKYSIEFKELLVRLGMPEFVFKMSPGNPNFVANANKRSMQIEKEIARTQKQYPDAKVTII